MPDQAQGPQQAQQGMQEGPQAPPQGKQSSFGMAEAGQGGAPMPSSGQDGGQQKSDSAEQKNSNPYRYFCSECIHTNLNLPSPLIMPSQST